MIPSSIVSFDAAALRLEVEEELQFHVDMCAREYESQGFSEEEATIRAKLRLGDVSKVKRQCVQIKARTNVRARAMITLCSLVLALGILIYVSAADFRVAKIGSVLIIIAVMGALLTIVKTLSVLHLVSEKKPLRLGSIDQILFDVSLSSDIRSH